MSDLDESWYIQKVKEGTGYTDVALASETTMDLIHDGNIDPKVTLGHEEIRLEFAESLFANLYNEIENHEILITAVHVICPRTGWIDVRKLIRDSLQGESPFPLDSDYSSVGTAGCSVVAKTNTKIWFTELFALVMPRIS